MSDGALLALYAAQEKCDLINTVHSSNFVEVWSVCFIVGGFVAVIIHVASILSMGKCPFLDESEPEEIDVMEPLAVKSSKTNASSAVVACVPSVAYSLDSGDHTTHAPPSPEKASDARSYKLFDGTVDPYACPEEPTEIESFHSSAGDLFNKNGPGGMLFFTSPSKPRFDEAVPWALGGDHPDAVVVDQDEGTPAPETIVAPRSKARQETFAVSGFSASPIQVQLTERGDEDIEVKAYWSQIVTDPEQLLDCFFEVVLEYNLSSTAAVTHMQWNIAEGKFPREHYIELLTERLAFFYGTSVSAYAVLAEIEATRMKSATTRKRDRVQTAGTFQSIRSCKTRVLEVDDPKPDLDAAEEHLRESSSTKDDGDWRGVWSTSLDELGEIGGPGIELYFRLLKGLGICFAYMGACTLPLVVFNWQGNFLPHSGNVAARSTIGNIGHIAPFGFMQESRYIILGCQGLLLKDATAIFGYLDSVSIVFFIVFLAQFWFTTLPSKVQTQESRMEDFTVEISALPPKISGQIRYQEMLTGHLEQQLQKLRAKRNNAPSLPPVKICEVCLARDYSGRLAGIQSQRRTNQKVEICKYKGQFERASALETNFEKGRMGNVLRTRLRPEPELPVVCAYAVLNCAQDVEDLLFRYTLSRLPLLRFCQKRSMKFQGAAIRIRRAPDPESIIPESQDMPRCEGILRRSFMLALWLVCMAASATILYLIISEAKTSLPAASSQLGSTTCDSGTFLPAGTYKCIHQTASRWNASFVATLSGAELDCFCQTRGHEGIRHTISVQTSATTMELAAENQGRGTCTTGYYGGACVHKDHPTWGGQNYTAEACGSDQAMGKQKCLDACLQDSNCWAVAFKLGTACARFHVTACTNDMRTDGHMLYHKTTRKKAQLVFEQKMCKSSEAETSRQFALTIAACLLTVFMNAGLRTIFSMSAEVERPSSIAALSTSMMWKVFVSQFFNTALVILLLNFTLFDATYNDFERGWYVLVAGALVVNLLFNSFVSCFIAAGCFALLRIRRRVCKNRAKHQADLLELFTNPSFDLGSRYAQVLTTVFCTLFYSSGLPLVTYLAGAYCFLNYWCDKWLLLRASSKPPLYDTSMTKKTLRALVWAVPLHCAVAIAMYGNDCIFPSDPLPGFESATGHWRRMTRHSTWTLSFLLIVVLIVVTIASLLSCFCGRRSSTRERALTFDMARPMIEAKAPPASYKLSRHPEFRQQGQYLRGECSYKPDR